MLEEQFMKKKWIAPVAAIMTTLMVFTSCDLLDDEEYDTDAEMSEEYDYDYDDSEQEETTAPASSALFDAGKDWEHEFASENTNAGTATVMVYMNGSDLESEAGQGSIDIAEMIDSGVGENVNVVIQTMGTKQWQDYGIASDRSQTYVIRDGGLELVRDDLGQLDCTRAETLSDFIGFCKTEFPADRYLFVFWDHGGGPVLGFGLDEWQSDEESLTISEIAQAFSEHQDIHFDIIGMDCCIMGNLETCYALSPFCRYALLSEDFESELGWAYTRWLKRLEETPGIAAPILGKTIVDDTIKENEENMYGDSACISLFNEAVVADLFRAWKAYAYKNEAAMLKKNFSRVHKARGRARSWWDNESNAKISDYYISDMLAIIESVDSSSDEAKKLLSALKASISYYGHTKDKNELTGLAVSLPYGDSDFYDRLKSVYSALGLDNDYIGWLKKFVSENVSFYDYDSFENDWSGWGAYESDYGCNISGGASCEYGYDYENSDYEDDWIYDAEEDIWYQYVDDELYLYDEESDSIFYYDEEEDEIYRYDESTDDWELVACQPAFLKYSA